MSGGPAAAVSQPRSASARRPGLRRLLLAVVLAAVIGAATWAITQNAPEFAAAFGLLHHVSVGWVIFAVALEVASYTTYAAGQRRLLRACDHSVGTGGLTALSAAAQALGNVIPVGSAAAGVYVVRQLHRRGVEEYIGVAVQAVTVLVYFTVLGGLGLIGAEIAGGGGPIDLRWTAAAVLAAAVAVLALVRVGMRHRWGMATAQRLQAHWPDLPWPDTTASARMRLPTPRGWTVVGSLMTASWLVDCGCLVLCAFAVSAGVPWRGLLVAYCAGQLAAIIPFAPGGLGVVEGSLTLALVAYGGTGQSTLAAVLLYRLITYWALLPVGAAAHVTLSRTWAPRVAPQPTAVPR